MKSDQKQTGPRFSYVDVMLLLLAAAALIGGILLIRNRTAGRGTPTRIVFTVSAELTTPDGDAVLSAIPAGSAVFDESGTVSLGTVRSVTRYPVTAYGVRDGEVVRVGLPDRVGILAEIVADADLVGTTGLRVENRRIAAGGKGNFRIGSVYCADATIRSVKRYEEEKEKNENGEDETAFRGG